MKDEPSLSDPGLLLPKDLPDRAEAPVKEFVAEGNHQFKERVEDLARRLQGVGWFSEVIEAEEAARVHLLGSDASLLVRHLLPYLVFSPYMEPTEPASEARDRRARIAAKARELRALIAQDPELSGASLSDFYDPSEHPRDFRGMAVLFQQDLVGFVENLATAADKAAEGNRPSMGFPFWDRVVPGEPKRSKDLDQWRQTLLERQLVESFRYYLGQTRADLVAPAVAIALDVETPGSSEIHNRHRNV